MTKKSIVKLMFNWGEKKSKWGGGPPPIGKL